MVGGIKLLHYPSTTLPTPLIPIPYPSPNPSYPLHPSYTPPYLSPPLPRLFPKLAFPSHTLFHGLSFPTPPFPLSLPISLMFSLTPYHLPLTTSNFFFYLLPCCYPNLPLPCSYPTLPLSHTPLLEGLSRIKCFRDTSIKLENFPK